jgi:hypothetical protein
MAAVGGLPDGHPFRGLLTRALVDALTGAGDTTRAKVLDAAEAGVPSRQ